MKKELVIFDMDQTLIEITPMHNDAINKSFIKNYRTKANFYEIAYAGRTIPDLVSELAKIKNVKLSKEGKEKLILDYIKFLKVNLSKNLKKQILPGINEVLSDLRRNKELIIVVATAGQKPIMKLALKNSKLDKYFDFCVSGTGIKNRKELIKKTIAIAKKKYKYPIKKIIAIGDSIHDIKAAKSNKIKIIAVKTGMYDKKELLKYKPDYYFENLKDTKKVIQAIKL